MSFRPKHKKHDETTTTSEHQEGSHRFAFEERTINFWNEYKNQLIRAAVVLVGVVIAIQLVSVLQDYRLGSVQKDFQNAYLDGSEEAKLEFAKGHSSYAMASSVYIELADKAYREDDYQTAIEHYQKAYKSLKGTALEARAALGLGISSVRAEDKEAGQKIFLEVLSSKSALDSHKAEAAYHLTILALEQNNFGLAKSYLKKIENMNFAGFWSQKILLLRVSVPELGLESA
jgi:tetratricopeptide (TPR) repeat protein